LDTSDSLAEAAGSELQLSKECVGGIPSPGVSRTACPVTCLLHFRQAPVEKLLEALIVSLKLYFSLCVAFLQQTPWTWLTRPNLYKRKGSIECLFLEGPRGPERSLFVYSIGPAHLLERL
jgi:hypothetical protein